MSENIQELNKYLQGWVAYFGIQEFKKIFGDPGCVDQKPFEVHAIEKMEEPA